MQDEVRGFGGPKEHFPMQSKFFDSHDNEKLENPDNITTYFHWVLSEVNVMRILVQSKSGISAVAKMMRDGINTAAHDATIYTWCNYV